MSVDILTRLERAGVRAYAERHAQMYGLHLADVLGRRRHAHLVRARHHLWRVTKDTLGLSWNEAGHLFGVDHTSVMHAVAKFERKL